MKCVFQAKIEVSRTIMLAVNDVVCWMPLTVDVNLFVNLSRMLESPVKSNYKERYDGNCKIKRTISRSVCLVGLLAPSRFSMNDHGLMVSLILFLWQIPVYKRQKGYMLQWHTTCAVWTDASFISLSKAILLKFAPWVFILDALWPYASCIKIIRRSISLHPSYLTFKWITGMVRTLFYFNLTFPSACGWDPRSRLV